MIQSKYILRKMINEILHDEIPDDEPLPWYLFEYFGAVLLDEAGYIGDVHELLSRVKSKIENEEGWDFD